MMLNRRKSSSTMAALCGSRAIAFFCTVLLVACDTGPTPMSGYADAELIYVSSVSAGTLEHVSVVRGQRVESGEVLFSLERTGEDAAADAAQARRDRAAAQADNLRQGRRPLEVQALRERKVQAQAALSASTAAWQRQVTLVKEGFVAPARLDELAAARDRDAATVREAEAQLLQAQLAARRDEQRAAEADTRAAAAELSLASWRQTQATRRAPVAAQVFDVLYRRGETVGAGTPVVALLPEGAIKLRFFVPQAELARAAVGSTVRVTCDGCLVDLTARIRWVSPQAEYTPPVIYSSAARAKLMFRVEAVPTVGAALLPGQPVDVRWAS